jgi:hypothetical protein
VMRARGVVFLAMGTLLLVGSFFEYGRRSKLEEQAAQREPTSWHMPTTPSVLEEGAACAGVACVGLGCVQLLRGFVATRRRQLQWPTR